MSLQKISCCTRGKKLLAILLACFLSACATQGVSESEFNLNNGSSADLIDPANKADLERDANLFSDLQSAEESTANIATALEEGGVSGTLSVDSESNAPFYSAVGGESLGRVAYSLYGDRKSISMLLEQNPGLKGQKNLAADQRVYFQFDNLKPEPVFLTKGLIDRYKDELSVKIKKAENISGEDKTVVAAGETLQKISQRLYGTTRYWTELYLLNHDTLTGYDKLKAGVELTYYKRTPDQLAVRLNATPLEQPLPVREAPTQDAAPTLANEDVNIQAENTVPTEAIPNEVPEPAPVPQEIPSARTVVTQSDGDRGVVPPVQTPERKFENTPPASTIDVSSNNNTRRIIYVALILAIALGAFYMTRPSKRQRSFDMANMSPDQTSPGLSSRPKLHEDNATTETRKSIG